MKKDLTILGLFVQDSMVYRSQLTLWMLTDVVPAMIMPFVWFAGMNGRSNIRGFGPSQFVMYYLTMTFLSNFIVSHIHWEVARDVKEGTLSKFLLYPLSYMRYQFLGNLAYRVMRCVIFLPFVVLWFAVFHKYMGAAAFTALHLGVQFWLALVLGHFVAFTLAWALGTLAFVFIETQSIFITYYVCLSILSGQLAPYSMLPHTLKLLAAWTPFRYTLSFPLEVLNGRAVGAFYWTGIAGQVAWLVGLYLVGRIGWARGTRRYAGAGM
jgi:ABC-2 type transport system permease protein